MDNSNQDRLEVILAGTSEAEEDFRLLAANQVKAPRLPADGALRNAWLAAYARKFAELAAPAMTENRLVAAGRAPRFHAGQRVEFTRFDLLALGRAEWQAGEVAGYFEPEWQPLPSVNANLNLTVQVTGKRGLPIGREIEVSEYQVRLPQDARVTA